MNELERALKAGTLTFDEVKAPSGLKLRDLAKFRITLDLEIREPQGGTPRGLSGVSRMIAKAVDALMSVQNVDVVSLRKTS